jgi:hypothetical protein
MPASCRHLHRILVGVALPTVALACTCGVVGPPCQAAWNASVVFAGTVVELSRDNTQPDNKGNVLVNGFLGTHAIFEVAEGFIGIEGPRKQVEVRTGMGGGDCGYPFQRQGHSAAELAGKGLERWRAGLGL